MSLLTNEQLAELIGIASNQSTSMDLYEEFHDWNKNQHPFNVNWDDAPDHAKIASIRIHWLTEINAGWSTTTEIISFDRPIVAHPHAEIMMKYAEVAARRVDPWVEFEWHHIDKWRPLTSWPTWGINVQYRHIGETK
jgi:hypothetical protein